MLVQLVEHNGSFLPSNLWVTSRETLGPYPQGGQEICQTPEQGEEGSTLPQEGQPALSATSTTLHPSPSALFSHHDPWLF